MADLDDVIKKMVHFNGSSKEDQEEAIKGVFILMAYAKAFEQALKDSTESGYVTHEMLETAKKSHLDAMELVYKVADSASKEKNGTDFTDQIIKKAVGRKRGKIIKSDGGEFYI